MLEKNWSKNEKNNKKVRRIKNNKKVRRIFPGRQHNTSIIHLRRGAAPFSSFSIPLHFNTFLPCGIISYVHLFLYTISFCVPYFQFLFYWRQKIQLRSLFFLFHSPSVEYVPSLLWYSFLCFFPCPFSSYYFICSKGYNSTTKFLIPIFFSTVHFFPMLLFLSFVFFYSQSLCLASF